MQKLFALLVLFSTLSVIWGLSIRKTGLSINHLDKLIAQGRATENFSPVITTVQVRKPLSIVNLYIVS